MTVMMMMKSLHDRDNVDEMTIWDDDDDSDDGGIVMWYVVSMMMIVSHGDGIRV